MNKRNLSILTGLALGASALAGAAEAGEGRSVTRVTEDGRTVVIVEHPTGTPLSQSSGTSGFSDGQTAQMAQQRFRKLDENNDGNLDRDELAADMTLSERFADYDINGDGVIERNEFQSYFAAQNWLEGEEQLPRRHAATAADDEMDDVDATADVDSDLDVDAEMDLNDGDE